MFPVRRIVTTAMISSFSLSGRWYQWRQARVIITCKSSIFKSVFGSSLSIRDSATNYSSSKQEQGKIKLESKPTKHKSEEVSHQGRAPAIAQTACLRLHQFSFSTCMAFMRFPVDAMKDLQSTLESRIPPTQRPTK
jgi:hypothetical protein